MPDQVGDAQGGRVSAHPLHLVPFPLRTLSWTHIRIATFADMPDTTLIPHKARPYLFAFNHVSINSNSTKKSKSLSLLDRGVREKAQSGK